MTPIPVDTVSHIKSLMQSGAVPTYMIAYLFQVSEISCYKINANERRSEVEPSPTKEAKREIMKLFAARLNQEDIK